MKVETLRKRLSDIVTCFEFEYKGKRGGVDPFSADRFAIFYNDESEYVDSIDKVFDTPFIDGKKLGDVLNDLDIINF